MVSESAKAVAKKKKVVLVARPEPNSIEQQIRERAYQLYEQRGGQHGHDVEDWLNAETEILEANTRNSAA